MTDIHAARWPDEEDELFARAIAVIDGVVRRRCRNWKLVGDLPGEVRSEVLLRLMRRLRDTESEPIERLDDYIAGIASRVIDDLVRTALPEWARLKHRVRYVLDHDDRFVVTLLDSRAVCSAPVTPFGRRRVQRRSAESLAKLMLDVMRDTFRELTIDDLVNEIAARTGVVDPGHAESSRIAPPLSVDPETNVESMQSLRALWLEIFDLPRRQRIALLVNARDAAGESVLRLLIEAGVVTAREVALAVDVRECELEALIGRLPMKDASIAEWLQVTRQQVINLRSAARDRLARRTARRRR